MYEYKVEKVLKVLDGDTVDLLVDLGFSSFKKDLLIWRYYIP